MTITITPTPSSGSLPLTTTIDVSISSSLTSFTMLYGDSDTYSVDPIQTWTQSLFTTSNPGTFYYYSYRQIIFATEISTSGPKFRIKLNAAATGDMTVYHVSIMERSGSTSSGVSSPVEITFNSGGHGCSITANTTIYSDSINFAIDETKTYLITIDAGAFKFPYYGPSASTTKAYIVSSVTTQQNTWDQQTYSYTGTSSYYGLMSEIQVLPYKSSFSTEHIYTNSGTYEISASCYDDTNTLITGSSTVTVFMPTMIFGVRS